MSLINYIEHISTFKYEIFKIKPDINFLKNYQNKKILMVGYNTYDTTLDCISIEEFQQLNHNFMNKYNLIVLGNRYNYESRLEIKKAIHKCKNNNKDLIFYGYTSFVNLNLDNSKKMFRPINLEKYPFNITNSKLIDDSFSYYHSFIYITTLIFIILINLKYDKLLYRLLLVIIIIFGIFLPRKHILYISNDKSE